MQNHENNTHAATDWIGLSAIIVTAMAWGLTGIFIQWLEGFSLAAVTGVRLLTAFIAVLPFLLFSRKTWTSFKTDVLNPWTWGLSVLLTVYYIAAVAAFQSAPIADVALLISTSSLFVFIYRIFFGIPTKIIEVFGAGLCIIGVALIVFSDASLSKPEWIMRLKGYGFALCAAWATATYATGYRITAQHGIRPIPFAQNVAIITFIIGGTILSLWSTIDMSSPDTLSKEAVLAFLALGLISTAIPSILFGVASARLPALVTTTVRLSTPVFAAIFSIILLNKPPSLWVLPGGTLILCGIFMVLSVHKKTMTD